MTNQPSYHNCPYCNALVLDGDPYCSKCGGPQIFKPKGGGVALNLDPWLITDPDARGRFEKDPQAVEALVNTWRHDPDFAQTREIQQQISAARERGDMTRVAWFYCCPWAPVYEANRDVTIGGKHIRRGERFTFDVSAEDVERGGSFRREVVIGDFKPTEEVDYCLPEDKN